SPAIAGAGVVRPTAMPSSEIERHMTCAPWLDRPSDSATMLSRDGTVRPPPGRQTPGRDARSKCETARRRRRRGRSKINRDGEWRTSVSSERDLVGKPVPTFRDHALRPGGERLLDLGLHDPLEVVGRELPDQLVGDLAVAADDEILRHTVHAPFDRGPA